MIEEIDDLIDLLFAESASRTDDRLLGGRDRLQERPIGGTATGHLHDADAVANDVLNGLLVEGCHDGQHALVMNGGNQTLVISLGELRAEEALDVLVAGCPVVGVDERFQVAVLEFDGRSNLEAAGDLCHLVDDGQAVFDVSLVVVRQFEDEQRGRIGVHDSGFLVFDVIDGL